MLRNVLLLVLAILVLRAVLRVIGGVMHGLSAPTGRSNWGRGRQVPSRGVQMVRDPVCGTYVIPDRSIALADGSRQVFFCSANCRDKYRARTA